MTFRQRTESLTDEHVDERASKFFSWGWAGSEGRSSFWNSRADNLVPTVTLSNKLNIPVCAYCGRQALPIQKRASHEEYYTTGYCCVCKDAMDELEVKAKIKEVIEKMERVVEDLEKSAPKVSKDVLKKLLEEKNKRSLDLLERDHYPTDYLAEELGFSLKTTKKGAVMNLSKQRGED